MKSKFQLFSSAFQLSIGVLAIAAFLVLDLSGEAMGRWVVTLLLAIAFFAIGVMGVVDYYKK